MRHGELIDDRPIEPTMSESSAGVVFKERKAMSLQRYDIFDEPHMTTVDKSPNGQYVLFTDHEAEIQRIKQSHGCAREQGVTQFCPQAEELGRKLAVAVEALEFIATRRQLPVVDEALEKINTISGKE